MNAATDVPWRVDFGLWPPADAARHRAVLAFDAAGRACLLADRAADPRLLEAAESRLSRALGWQVCEPALIDTWIEEAQGQSRALDGVAASGVESNEPTAPELTLLGMSNKSSPAVRLLDAVLYDALKDGASDVHLETRNGGAEVRVRLDGVMLPLRRVDGAALAEQMVSRLKIMSELDIGERRLPQDGRFKLRAFGRDIDFRLSIMPSVHGEDAVVRVLDRAAVERSGGSLTLASLGFAPALCAQVLALARQPHGMLLVTGPTGSGKTTTLYAAISEIHDGSEKIITIEDPVEYQLAGVLQIPVNEKKGLTFARGLRSILRHDPDRIMVGEIRDAETAQIAIQAALTGHLVLSSVHANNTFDVIGRFTHMEVDPYSFVSALRGVLAQRLVRVNCPQCSQATPVDAAAWADSGLDPALADGAVLRAGRGCGHCRGSGFKGRRAVGELLLLDDGLREMIVARAPAREIKQAARDNGTRFLRESAVALMRQGHTTLDEVNRVTMAD